MTCITPNAAIHGAWTRPKPADPAPPDDANEEAQRTQDQYLLNNPRRIKCRVCGGVHPYATRQCTPTPIRKDDLTSAQQYVPGSGKAPISDGEAEYLREQLRGKGETEYTRGERRQWRFDQHGQDPAELRGPFSLLRVDATRRNEQFERELVEMCDDAAVALTLTYDEELRCYWVDLKRGSGDTHPIWRWAWDQERVLVEGWPWEHRK